MCAYSPGWMPFSCHEGMADLWALSILWRMEANWQFIRKHIIMYSQVSFTLVDEQHYPCCLKSNIYPFSLTQQCHLFDTSHWRNILQPGSIKSISSLFKSHQIFNFIRKRKKKPSKKYCLIQWSHNLHSSEKKHFVYIIKNYIFLGDKIVTIALLLSELITYLKKMNDSFEV